MVCGFLFFQHGVKQHLSPGFWDTTSAAAFPLQYISLPYVSFCSFSLVSFCPLKFSCHLYYSSVTHWSLWLEFDKLSTWKATIFLSFFFLKKNKGSSIFCALNWLGNLHTLCPPFYKTVFHPFVTFPVPLVGTWSPHHFSTNNCWPPCPKHCHSSLRGAF